MTSQMHTLPTQPCKEQGRWHCNMHSVKLLNSRRSCTMRSRWLQHKCKTMHSSCTPCIHSKQLRRQSVSSSQQRWPNCELHLLKPLCRSRAQTRSCATASMPCLSSRQTCMLQCATPTRSAAMLKQVRQAPCWKACSLCVQPIRSASSQPHRQKWQPQRRPCLCRGCLRLRPTGLTVLSRSHHAIQWSFKCPEGCQGCKQQLRQQLECWHVCSSDVAVGLPGQMSGVRKRLTQISNTHDVVKYVV